MRRGSSYATSGNRQGLGDHLAGIVEAAAVRVINIKLAKLATDPRVVRGSVRDPDGNPFSNGFVEIFSQGSNGERAIGKSPLDAADGSNEILYQLPTSHEGECGVDPLSHKLPLRNESEDRVA